MGECKAKLTLKTNAAFMMDVRVSDLVFLSDRRLGVVHYVGQVHFSPGTWYGIALSKPEGKHNGTIEGTPYFKCKPYCGVFVMRNKIARVLQRRGNAVSVTVDVLQDIQNKTGECEARIEALT